MKIFNIRLLQVIIFILIFKIGTAQDYTPFYMDNAKWTMKQLNGFGADYQIWEIYTLDDTLINNNIYRKLGLRNRCSVVQNQITNELSPMSVNTDEFILGGLREENKKVYFLKFELDRPWEILQGGIHNLEPNQDHLLYDFDIIEGDTIRYSEITSSSILNGDTTTYTRQTYSIVKGILNKVEGHNSYDVANSTSFVFPIDSEPLIEGVGSYFGLFGSYDSYLSNLICFTIDDEPLIYDSICDPCEEFVSNKNVAEIKSIEIYPNPADSELFITNNGQAKVDQIQLYDVSGQLLQEFSEPENNFRIETSLFQSGIFFLHIRFRDGARLVKKLIIN